MLIDKPRLVIAPSVCFRRPIIFENSTLPAPRAFASPSRENQGTGISSLIKNVAVGVASATALAATAALFMKHTATRQHHSERQDRRQPNMVSDQIQINTIDTSLWSKIQWKRRSPDAEVALIDAKRAREAAHDLDRWDRRFHLRAKSLNELRVLAAKYKVNGRAKMRKSELVAVLEQKFGLVS